MILTGPKILEEVEAGRINITPFYQKNINPNSYNLTMDNRLLEYTELHLSMSRENRYKVIEIPKRGKTLYPGQVYLGNTVERIWSDRYVPRLDGRSSTGRLGLNVHATAGFVDVGFCGQLTLEISVIQPVIILPYTQVCQISFQTLDGDIQLYDGKYNHQYGPTPSRSHLDL